MLDFDVKFDLAEQDRRLSKLLYADGANFDSPERQNEPYCLVETRIDILCQIMEWSADPCQKTIFWLNGMAGTGKSTIARTIARTLTEQKRLAASFFFSRGRGDLSHTGKLFSTIARQFAATSWMLKRYICEAIAEHSNISQQSMRDQWTKLVYQPLLKLEGSQQSPLTLVLVIDALDKCRSQEDVRILLQLLTEVRDLKNVLLRVLVTSRPETSIHLGFRNISGSMHKNFVLHDIPAAIIRHDIAVFLKHELGKIKEERLLPFDWAGEQKLELVIKKSGELFIYAATVCRFVQDPKWLPEKRLDVVLQSNDPQWPTQRLDEVYIQILRASVIGDCNEKEKDILAQRFRDTVGPILVLFASLSTVTLARLFPALSDTISITLGHLKSVLKVPEDHTSAVQLLHPSYRDFLVNQERCLDRHFWINVRKAHHNIVKQCLCVMSNSLKRTSVVSGHLVLLAFMNDARRFILESRYIVEKAPLQVYNSALIFSPRASNIRHLYLDKLPSWIDRLPIVEDDWTPSLQALEGHSDWALAIVFSPNGQLLASASNDHTVRLWDPATGASRGTLKGHSNSVTAVVF